MGLRSRARQRLLPVYQHAVRRSPDLTYLFFEITQRCNLSCVHCGSDCAASSEHPDLPVALALGAATRVAEAMDTSRITAVITGGEPLCHPDVFELGAGLAGLGFRWGMVTNGYLWDIARAQAARDARMHSVCVSLDGLEAGHDAFRGRPGSFARALGAIDLLMAAPRLPVMDVVTCVHPGNLHELDSIHDLLVAHGLRQWRLFTIDPIGRGAAPMLQLDTASFQQLLRDVARFRERGTMKVNFGCGGYLGGELDSAVRDHDYFCMAGIRVAGVMVDGGILACPNNDRAMVQGNIHSDDLVEVWRERFEPFRRRGHMRTGACQGCDEWALCQGNDMHLWDPQRGETRLCHYREYELEGFEP